MREQHIEHMVRCEGADRNRQVRTYSCRGHGGSAIRSSPSFPEEAGSVKEHQVLQGQSC